MHDIDAVLAANDRFYRAFADNDPAAMDALWAQRVPVACLHPGWPPLTDRDEIVESWRRILSNPAQKAPVCREPEVLLYGDMAMVLCYEDLGGQVLIASNLFVQEGGRWRMVHHQSGPVARPAEAAPQPSSRSLH